MYIYFLLLHNPRRPHCSQDAGWKSVDELIPKRVFFIGRLSDEESSSALLCALKSIKLLRLDDSNLFFLLPFRQQPVSFPISEIHSSVPCFKLPAFFFPPTRNEIIT
jgi:hypothetical protein